MKRSSNDQSQGNFLEPGIYEPFNLISVKQAKTKDGQTYLSYLFKAKEGIHAHTIFRPTKQEKDFNNKPLSPNEQNTALDKKINKAADDIVGIAERIVGHELEIDVEYGDDFTDEVWEQMVIDAQNLLPIEYANVDLIGKIVVNLFGKQPKVQLPYFIKSGLIRMDEKDKNGNPRKLYMAKDESADIEKYNKARALQTSQTQVDDKVAEDSAAAFISKRKQIVVEGPKVEEFDGEAPFDLEEKSEGVSEEPI